MKIFIIAISLILPVTFSDGVWSEWGVWSDSCDLCSGSLTRGRSRVCIPDENLNGCSGSRIEYEKCECPTKSQWSEWSDWTLCDKDCGYCGTQNRTRECVKIDGCPEALCEGNATESQSCSTTDQVCLIPLPSCCDRRYKKKADIKKKKFYCGLR